MPDAGAPSTGRHYGGPPVPVVGNGPVGQSAALLLARWGIPTVLLDRRPSREVVGSKAICQQRDVLDIWSSVGAAQIAAEGLTWTTGRTFYKEHELETWSFVDRGRSPLPPFVNISQSRVEELLDRAIHSNPLIDVRWNHEVVAVQQTSADVTLMCSTERGPVRIRAPYAFLAAGSSAEALRAQLGVHFAGDTFDDRFLICDIRTELPGWESERRFYFDPPWNPDRQVLIHPCPESTFRIDWQVPAGFDLATEERTGALDDRIRMVIGDRPYDLQWRSVYRFHTRCADRMVAGRVLLLGDCAHVVAPFGARGLNSGVMDAENAAWKLAFVLYGWAPESLIGSYQDERRAAALENCEVTAATMRFLVPRTDADWDERKRLLEGALRDAQARARVDSGRFSEPFWYVDSPLTTPSRKRRFAGRPPKGATPEPAPGVLVPDAPVAVRERPDVVRMRELVRDGIVVLAGDGVDCSVLASAVEEATCAPSNVLRLPDIDVAGAVGTALGARPDEAWLLRPDGHIAAVLPEPDRRSVVTAVRRLLGHLPQ